MKGVIIRNLRDTIFYMKMNVLQKFCISVPLTFHSFATEAGSVNNML